MTTISVIKADVGGFPGHSRVHEELIKIANKELAKEKGKILTDFFVGYCGDDLELIMTHKKGADSKEVHGLAWNVFERATEKAKELKLYGAGQDLLADAFSGNIRGAGPGIAELDFDERKSEPVIVFMADKTDPGAFNLPMYRIFADPFNTAGLVIDPSMHDGFRFEVWDVYESRKVFFNTPEETYDMLALIGGRSRYIIKRVYPRKGNKVPENEAVAAVSTEKINLIAGEYVGKDDPVAIVRAQSGLPAVGEVLEAFAFPELVSGWMRGSHCGPIMPVAMKDATPTRFDGPPRIVALGFQIANGKLVGPADMFEDKAYDSTRMKAQKIAEYMRRHGPFEPHRLPAEDMEYTTLPKVLKKLEGRFQKI